LCFDRGKREACEISFMDFDDVSLRVRCNPETANLVEVHLGVASPSNRSALFLSSLLKVNLVSVWEVKKCWIEFFLVCK
jgi:hypothetical protein